MTNVGISASQDTHLCRLHGLNVTSPFRLSHDAPADAQADLHISVDRARVSQDFSEEIPGRVVSRHSPAWPDYQVIDRGTDGYAYRIRYFADIDISSDQRCLHCRLDERASEGLLPVMLAGHVLSTLLFLQGELVIHASAVELDGVAIAFVGNSGAGKSTLAAMACHRGAKLVTDDVLRVTPEDSGMICYRGAAALRLRSGSKALASIGSSDGGAGDLSADGRHLFVSPPTSLDRLPLAAVFVPNLREADHALTRTRLNPQSALFTVLRYPRVQNWTDPATGAMHFDKLATLVETVPVYELDVPWGVQLEDSWLDRFAEVVFSTG